MSLQSYYTLDDLINNSIYAINGEIIDVSTYNDGNISITREPITYADDIDVIIDVKEDTR
ncbi:MAG: hypothetical protein KatS3mg003_0161 [Candidatus Nitrosocaldaceae archaeon]|nr:MAG: hypothetical protein KatS3mg003_0161 [Candidatus Nitrosocaldaceae archaeon]